MFSRENPSTGQTHAGLIRGPPAINQQEQCILGVGGTSCLKMVEVLRPFLAERIWVAGLSPLLASVPASYRYLPVYRSVSLALALHSDSSIIVAGIIAL